jgi:hypothetical protein
VIDIVREKRLAEFALKLRVYPVRRLAALIDELYSPKILLAHIVIRIKAVI